MVWSWFQTKRKYEMPNELNKDISDLVNPYIVKSRKSCAAVLFSCSAFQSLTIESHINICKVVQKLQEIRNNLREVHVY